jgi:predicted DNA-binding protein (MmcQ/YjbR family)
MTRSDFNAFCSSLPATTHVVQWGGSDVWKVGGKVFAICGWDEEEKVPGITFKTSEIAFEILRDMPGLRPAPYLASRGMKWIQRHGKPGLPKAQLRDYLTESYNLVVAGLTKKKRAKLKLEPKAAKSRR